MMRFQLRKCTKCKSYTLKDMCKRCDEKTKWSLYFYTRRINKNW